MATKIPLSQVIAEIIDAADVSEHQYRRLYNLGVQSCRKFNMDIYGAFKTVLLDVSANGSVAWPKDYLDYSMLGLINDAGEAVPLKHNEQLIPLKQAYLASQQKVVDVPTVGDFFSGDLTVLSNYWLNFGFNNFGFIHLYGIGGGTATIGEFQVDDANKCFLVNPDWPYSSIVLEYLSDGLDCETNEYMVDVFAVDAFKMWVMWQSSMYLTKKYSLSQVNYYKQQFAIERRQARLRINKVRVNEMQVVARAAVKLTARA